MKKVKALETIAGDYGRKSPDDEPFEVTDSVAEQLAAAGRVKIVGSAGADPEPERDVTKVAPAQTKEKSTPILHSEKNKNAGPNPTSPVNKPGATKATPSKTAKKK